MVKPRDCTEGAYGIKVTGTHSDGSTESYSFTTTIGTGPAPLTYVIPASLGTVTMDLNSP